jgi:hypothetical protein
MPTEFAASHAGQQKFPLKKSIVIVSMQIRYILFCCIMLYVFSVKHKLFSDTFGIDLGLNIAIEGIVSRDGLSTETICVYV